MIYNAFPFFNELDLLEIKLHELDPVVDWHVLAESPWTHTGKPKPLYFQENRERFAKFLPKIRHVIVEDMPNTDNPWDNEKFQFESVMRGMQDASDNDRIIMGATDEIPRAESVTREAHDVPVTFEFQSFGIYANLRCGTWEHCVMIPASIAKQHGPYAGGWHRAHEFRVSRNAGWHFSSCGGVERMRQKFSSFAHQEDITQRFNNDEAMGDWYDLKANYWEFLSEGKPCQPHILPIDASFPKYLVENQEKFRHLIAKI